MVKVAINGFGRIGRVTSRILLSTEGIELVGINDPGDPETMAHLMKYDSIHGRFPGEVRMGRDSLVLNGHEVSYTQEKDPEHLSWKERGAEVVIESSGLFLTREKTEKHLKAGAERVLLSAPPKDEAIPTVVCGVNDEIVDGSERVLSNASCTTNNAAPMVGLLDEICGVQGGYITTVHAYTGDQRLHDAPHKDLRRARAAAESIVPTTTGAAKAITKIFPHLDGKMGGCGIRVPVANGSLTDITCHVTTPKDGDTINEGFREAANGKFSGILSYNEDPVVSPDIIGDPHSCIFDPLLTSVVGDQVKLVGWYDNEWGYANRLVDLIRKKWG